jgi:SAM-dependent methyltransferase
VVYPFVIRVDRAYDSLAPVYDDFTAHHDYDAWTSTLEHIAHAHGLRGRRLLDVACGTGKSFLPFLERGFEVTACDISERMLAVAGAKARGRARLLRADMRALPPLGRFDLVTCLDDAVNYLDDERDLVAAFRGMGAALAPGGLLLFDVNTLGIYRDAFSRVSCHEVDGCLFLLRGEASTDLAEGGLAPAVIEAFRPTGDGRYERFVSRHEQRHHGDARVRRALAAAGLRHRAAHGLTPDGALHEDVDEIAHSKRIYVAGLALTDERKEVSDAPHQEAGGSDRPGRLVHQGELIPST